MRDLRQIAIDEVCIGSGHKYLTVVLDLLSDAVVYIGDGKDGDAPLDVQFTDASTLSGIASWHWDFGDGQTSTDQHPSHTYALPSAYTVALTITAPTGEAAKTRPDYIIVTGKLPHQWHNADTDQDNAIRIPELLRAIQFYNVGAFHCQPGSDDGYAPNPGDATCPYHDSDFAPPPTGAST